MTLDELKSSWVSDARPEVQARIWNRAASDYGKRPLPDIDHDPFLKLLFDSYPVDKMCRILDIGCGAGGYTLALAPFVLKAVGIDISSGMIDLAEARAKSMGLANAQFSCLNWSDADIDMLGLREQFQVVFAHMTPAICDFSTLEKMDNCATKLCMLEKPTRRKDAVLDQALRLVQIEPDTTDNGLQNIFAFLWCKGYEPQFFYHRETWNTDKSTEDMVAWCTDRAKLRKPLTLEEESAIRIFVESLSENGAVRECTTTTRVTIIWNKEK